MVILVITYYEAQRARLTDAVEKLLLEPEIATQLSGVPTIPGRGISSRICVRSVKTAIGDEAVGVYLSLAAEKDQNPFSAGFDEDVAAGRRLDAGSR